MIDIIGKRFGKLKVLKKGKKLKNYNQYYICKCDCGNKKEIAYSSLSSGVSQSCGCLRREKTITRFTTHGLGRTKFYNIFFNIKKRCINKNNLSYKNYGGRGIKCEWEKFEDFKNDMYESYLEHCKKYGEKNTTIERINNDGNYCKENCKWATRKEQANNKRNNILITHNGTTKTFYDWIDYLGLNKSTIESRVYELGWNYEKALFTNIRIKNGNKKK